MIRSFLSFLLVALFVQVSLAKEIKGFFNGVSSFKEYPLKDLNSGTPSDYYILTLSYSFCSSNTEISFGDTFAIKIEDTLAVYPIEFFSNFGFLTYGEIKLADCRFFSKFSMVGQPFIECTVIEEFDKINCVEGEFPILVVFDDGVYRYDFSSNRKWNAGINKVTIDDFNYETYHSSVGFTPIATKDAEVLTKYLGDDIYYLTIKSPEITCDEVESGEFYVTIDGAEVREVDTFMFSSVNEFDQPISFAELPDFNETVSASAYSASFGAIPKGHRFFFYGDLLAFEKLTFNYQLKIKCADTELEISEESEFYAPHDQRRIPAKQFSKRPRS